MPSVKAEMVTEILFGEQLTILEKKDNWLAISCNWDNYQGWMDCKQAMELKGEKGKKIVLSEALTTFKTNLGTLRLSAGSELFVENGIYTLGAYHFTGDTEIKSAKQSKSRKDLLHFGMQYLNVPYLWGGRSIFGIDCSGLTQVCYKLCGIDIPRDASQQARTGADVSFVENAQPGDLAFFENKEGKIIHVGMLLKNRKILHASGQVRIDTIDHQGIFNEELGRYTHQLRLIKSYDLS